RPPSSTLPRRSDLEGARPVDELVDLLAQRLGAERLGEITGRAVLAESRDVTPLNGSGDEHDRYVAETGSSVNGVREGESAHLRHGEIGHDELGQLALDRGEPFAAVHRELDRMSRRPHRRLDQFSDLLLVLAEDYPCHVLSFDLRGARALGG